MTDRKRVVLMNVDGNLYRELFVTQKFTRNQINLHASLGRPKRSAKDFQYISEMCSYFGAYEGIFVE